MTGVAASVHLANFVERHPGCRVGRPPWQLWAAALGLATVGAFGGIVVALAALVEGVPTIALLAAIVAFTTGAALPRVWARFAPLWMLLRENRKCYAVSDEAMILVDARGGAVEVALDRIVALEIDGDEPRLRIDDEDQQGLIYAALFDVFDDEGPSGEGFFEALEPRLKARMPGAQIVRHGELPLY